MNQGGGITENERVSPKVEIFLEDNREFVRCSPEEELGKLVNLVKSSYEPVLVYDNDKYLGSISLQNSIFNSRLAYKSRADNNLVTGGPVTMEDTINTAIRFMISYGWLRVPVFDEKRELAGQLRARQIIKTLADNETFLGVMVLKSRIRKPIILGDNAKVEDAYNMLKSKWHTKVFVVDDRGNIAGSVGKSSLMKAFNKKVESKRFDTKNGNPAHNIYVGEKIDRDDYPLRNYINRRQYGLTAEIQTDKTEMINKLVNSGFNSLTIINKEGVPKGVLSLRDLLRSVLFWDPTGELNFIIRGFEEVKETEMHKINGLIANLSEYVNKIDDIDQIELSSNEVKTSEGKVNVYELMLRMELGSGETYLAHQDSRDLIKGVGQITDEIRKQIRRSVWKTTRKS